MPMRDVLWGLTDKEKETLRLIVRGHDAKSVARSLGLSVHTINERLRDARRKMAVPSSREAARLLLDAESRTEVQPSNSLGDSIIGEDRLRPREDQASAPIGGAGGPNRWPLILTGVLLMTFAFGLLALVISSQVATTSPPTASASLASSNSEVVDFARQWLSLVDQGRWKESYEGTGTAFQKLNTAQVWAATSIKVRVPLGAVVSRTFLSQENLPAPPYGYEVVKFRTDFANKAGAIETVSMARENGKWRVAGVLID